MGYRLTIERSFSLKQKVYHHIKDAIYHREMAPGLQLIETDISKQLNVSRTPIRQAFQQLAKEGLLELIPNRGAYIANPSHDEIFKISQARALIESNASVLAIESVTCEDLNELDLLVVCEEKASYQKDLERYLYINKVFHLTIIKKANNQYLSQFAEKLIDQTNIYLIFYDQFFDQNNRLEIAQSPTEHRKIIQLLRERNKEELQRELRKHVQASNILIKEKHM